MRIALLMMCICAVVLFAVPRLWLAFLQKARKFLMLVELAESTSCSVACLHIVISGGCCFAGLKKPMFGMILGGYRLIIAPVTLFWFFSEVLGYGLNGIWVGLFLTSFSGAIITWFFVKYTFLKITTQSV